MMNKIHSTILKHPILVFLVISLSISWIVLSALGLKGLPMEPGLLILVYIGLLGSSLFITYQINGKKGVKELLRGVLIWRVGIGYYLLSILSIPLVTIAIANFTGNLEVPKDGWGNVVITYVVSLLSGLLIINLWEETAWTGFMQKRVMDEKGIFVGSLITALPFTAIHLPLIFFQSDISQLAFNIFMTLLLSVFFRYLVGMLFYDTKGSLLLVGLLHASNNSSNSWSIIEGEYELIAAIIFITIVVAAIRKFQNRTRV